MAVSASTDWTALFSLAMSELSLGRTVAMATVVEAKGSAPQCAGARMILLADGRTLGTIGGGAIEHRIVSEMASCAESRLLRFDLIRDLGMCCGGTMSVFVERLDAKPRVWIFGAGHVAMPTAKLLAQTGLSVTVVDRREELNCETRFPDAERLHIDYDDAPDLLKISSRDFALVMTHDHALDEQLIEWLSQVELRYLGVIGSKRKILVMAERLAVRGKLPPLDRFYAPVGLDIGAVTPDEIALSIASEITVIRRNVQGAAHLTMANKIAERPR